MTEIVVDELRPSIGRHFDLWVYATPEERCGDVETWLEIDGDEQPPSDSPLRNRLRVVAQPTGDLAERLETAGRLASEQGAPSVVFIGTDCIDLRRWDLVWALTSLDASPSVLGPSADGGFWALAVRLKADPDAPSVWPNGLFRGIPYSTSETGERMTEALKRYGLGPAAQLPQRRDVDTLADLLAQPPWVRSLLRRRARTLGIDLPWESWESPAAKRPSETNPESECELETELSPEP